MTSGSQETAITKRLEGKVAIITGGASGIGECTTRLFIRHGAKVVVADVQDELGHALCQDIGSEETITYVHCDVSCNSDVERAVNTAVVKYGKLDIMFNNAGIFGNMNPKILTTDDQDFKRVLEVNVVGSYLGAKHAARVMIPAKKGCILFTSSIASIISMETPHAYTASKHDVLGLTKNLCAELGKYGIRVNCISPYGVATLMLRNAMGMMEKEKVEEVICSAANLKEAVLEPEDIAEAALYLASDESKYVSGLNLVVDGGYTVTNPTLDVAMNRLFHFIYMGMKLKSIQDYLFYI